MTHLPYIIAAYAIGAAGISWLSIGATIRLAAARRRQAAIDPRARTMAGGAPGEVTGDAMHDAPGAAS